MKKMISLKILIFFVLLNSTISVESFVIRLIGEINQLTQALDEYNRRNRENLASGIKSLFNHTDNEEKEISSTGENTYRTNRSFGINFKFGSGTSLDEELGEKVFSFKDLAGEVPQDVKEVVHFLKKSDKFLKVGAQMPKGILLVGPPGTGKTSIARAIAGEANAAFFSASGSEFIEKYVGVGPQRIRELFQKARNTLKNPNDKAIIFIDELDAIGGQRHDSENSEYRNTLNELLNQMDGFKQNQNILVMGATNTPHSIDTALKRPGRFDRIVEIDLPNENSRFEILKHYSSRIALDETMVDLNRLAKQTALFSPAELKNLVNEAAIRAAREDVDLVSAKHFDKALESVKNCHRQ